MSDHEDLGWIDLARDRMRGRGFVDPQDDWPHLPRAGELRLARPIESEWNDSRMVYVVGVDPEVGVAKVLLVSNEVESASDTDLIGRGERMGLPFDLMFETQNVAHLWLSQLGHLVQTLDSEMSLALEAAAKGGRDEWPKHESGLPILVNGDVRQTFRQQEREALTLLAADCVSHLSGSSSPRRIVFDPILFASRPRESEDERLVRMLEIAEEVDRNRDAMVPDRSVERELVSIKVDAAPWERQNLDEHMALMPLCERLLSTPTTGAEGVVELRPDRRTASFDSDLELMEMLSVASRSGCRSVQMLTAPDAWVGGFAGPMAMARATMEDSVSLQIIRRKLEAIP